MPPHVSSFPSSPITSSPDTLTHSLHFMTLAPIKHPDDVLSEKTHLWRTHSASLTERLFHLVPQQPFALPDAKNHLSAVTHYEELSQKLIEQTTRLERPVLQALSLDSTLEEHRRCSNHHSCLDWLDIATHRAQRLDPTSSRLNKEQESLVNPQSLVELRAAVACTDTKFSQTLGWVKAPLQMLINSMKKKLFPKQVATVALPKDTQKLMKKTLQGSTPQRKQRLGSGAFGQVTALTWNQHAYALKELTDSSEKTNQHESAPILLMHEGAAYMSLDHPNIIKIKGISEEGLYMEKVNGNNFQEVLERHYLSQGELSNYLLNIAEALCYLHNKGFIHKDVKLANVLIDSNTQCAKLCDLGLIANSENDTCKSGSVRYRAPEIAQASREAPLSSKVDVWSFGVLLYNALANTPHINPFPQKLKETSNKYTQRLSIERFMKACTPKEIFSHLRPLHLFSMQQLDIKSSVFKSYGILQELVVDCLHGDPSKRPSMEEVVDRLKMHQKRIKAH